MRVFLDDERATPAGYVGVRWPEEAVTLLRTGEVSHLSLDHDLGEVGAGARTGYDVILWVEEQVALHGFRPPAHICIHSANSAAGARMRQGVRAIYDIARQMGVQPVREVV